MEANTSTEQNLVSTREGADHISPAPKTWNVFVGDLQPTVTDDDLREKFSPCGEIYTVNVFRDRTTNQCKGYGFVHFLTREAQIAALNLPYSNQVIKGRPCRTKLAEQKLTLFVRNLPMDMSQDEIRNALSELCKNVTSSLSVDLKTGPPPDRKSRGFCFVTFGAHEQAAACKKVFSVSTIKGRSLTVSWAETTSNRDVDGDIMSKVTTLYVSNISTSVQEDILRSLFTQFGEVVKCVIVKTPTGESRGFAFVQFAQREPCINAMNCLNNSEFAGQRLSVVLAKPPPPTPSYKLRSRPVIRGRYYPSPFEGMEYYGQTMTPATYPYTVPRGRGTRGRGTATFRGGYAPAVNGNGTAGYGRGATPTMAWTAQSVASQAYPATVPYPQSYGQIDYQQHGYDPNQQWGAYAPQGASVRYSPY